jgi:hypothetical protein
MYPNDKKDNEDNRVDFAREIRVLFVLRKKIRILKEQEKEEEKGEELLTINSASC